MKTPREDLIAEAMGALGGAGSLDDFAGAAESLTRAMGLQRYMIIDVRSGRVEDLHHNAPSALRKEVRHDGDPVAAKAMVSRIPFTWRENTGGAWRDRHGGSGYRSGVVGATWNSDGTGCIVMLSCADESIAPTHAATLITFALMAAVTAGSALSRLAPTAECPFPPRELDSLLYALAGKTSKETARALGIEDRTVRQYLERARARLGVSTSYAAATTALRRGWLDIQQASELAGLGPSAGAR